VHIYLGTDTDEPVQAGPVERGLAAQAFLRVWRNHTGRRRINLVERMFLNQMVSDYERYHFSATCETSDSAVLHCLRALCQWAEEWKKPQIGWGGTGESDWKALDGKFTLRFTTPDYRRHFLDKADELLKGRWRLVSTNDNDPARRQRAPH
jgi:hypothetical protein